jgi:hypothetical protein
MKEARLLTANIYQLREFDAPEKRSRYIFANRYGAYWRIKLASLM